MKTDIKQVSYMDINESGDWYVWNEFCDLCGKQYKGHNVSSGSKPDENENDYCLDCMREMIDNKIKEKINEKI